MTRFTRGNLLEADAEALVNTVNTVGVMGKGIALMFKERYPENFRLYAAACRRGEVRVGQMFMTQTNELSGPKWVINFPTKQHWRSPSRMEWVVEGLSDLRRALLDHEISSVAIPPLGCGNGGLPWADVRQAIERGLADLDVDVLVYEPTPRYQNVAKPDRVDKLTPARALIAEMIRRYWVLGIECTLLEIQKIAWFLERSLVLLGPDNPLDLRFEAHRYGPYADRLRHLLDRLDGSYLHCTKRLADAGPRDTIHFLESKRAEVETYLDSDAARAYRPALERTDQLIDGFQSPLGMELLATVDWLATRESCSTTLEGIRAGLESWPDSAAAERKRRLFDDRLLGLAIERLHELAWQDSPGLPSGSS